MIERELLESCEKNLIAWFRREAARMNFGSITVQLKVDVHNSKPVMLTVSAPATVEEKFR